MLILKTVKPCPIPGPTPSSPRRWRRRRRGWGSRRSRGAAVRWRSARRLDETRPGRRPVRSCPRRSPPPRPCLAELSRAPPAPQRAWCLVGEGAWFHVVTMSIAVLAGLRRDQIVCSVGQPREKSPNTPSTAVRTRIQTDQMYART